MDFLHVKTWAMESKSVDPQAVVDYVGVALTIVCRRDRFVIA